MRNDNCELLIRSMTEIKLSLMDLPKRNTLAKVLLEMFSSFHEPMFILTIKNSVYTSEVAADSKKTIFRRTIK